MHFDNVCIYMHIYLKIHILVCISLCVYKASDISSILEAQQKPGHQPLLVWQEP